ncbi:MAG: PBP1A family penicillin-binding protein [Anaerolineae bacterium]|nr:PBP1A family penicillin-binding protein [Anaerolineae bacterium]
MGIFISMTKLPFLSRFWRWLRVGHRRLTAGGILGLLIGAAIGIRLWLFTDLPHVDDLSQGLNTPSIRITDRYGRMLYEVIGENAGRNTVVPLEQIPLACRQATIATEDASFYTNPGVDLRGIVRALWINLQGGEVLSGGSTITQQVARNLLLEPRERTERSLTRKLRESILAYRLSRRYSKDEILAFYLNQTYYGNLAYGIDAAARAYLGKPVNDLDLAECALLAGLPQSPALYDPLTDPAATQKRQSVVLDLMVDSDFIDIEEAASARHETLAFAAERYSIEAPHFVMAIYAQLEETLTPAELYQGGLEVRTTLDLDWQDTAERIARRHLELLNRISQPGDIPHNAHNAALVALDPHTGQVLALLGSPDFFDAASSGAVNMALAPRQPGSSFKPFTYAAAFDPTQQEPWTAATMILDVRTSFVTHEGYSYVPTNYDHQEHGPVLVREALASSYNIPAVIALQHVGMSNLFQFAGRLGITTFTDPSAHDLSLTLGGGEVRLLELAAAYAALANGGRVIEPVMILDIKDTEGQTIFSEQGHPGEQVIDPRVAWLITDILNDNLARAPTFTTHSILQIGRPAAAKTGTTTDYRDNWTVGYTPNLVVGVWVGNADNSSMSNISGVSGAGPIWHQFMRTVLRGQPELEFERPSGLVQVEICSLSGLLPTPDCPYTRREWFIEGTQPTERDNIYQRVIVDAATGMPATNATPIERHDERIFLDLPPQAHGWARAAGLSLLPEAFDAQTVLEDTADAWLMVITPDPQTIYRISSTIPLDAQKIRIVVAGTSDLDSVTIYLDDELLAAFDEPPFEVLWILRTGTHTIYATGTTVGGEELASEVVQFTVKPAE